MVKERILRVLILFILSSFKSDCFAQISMTESSMMPTSETTTMPASSTPLDPSSTIAISTLPASTDLPVSPTTASEAAATLKPQEATTAPGPSSTNSTAATNTTLLVTNSSSLPTTITPSNSTSSPSSSTTRPLNTTGSPLPSTISTNQMNTTSSPLTSTIKPFNSTSNPILSTGIPTSTVETVTGSSSTINATTTTTPPSTATTNCSCKGINEECSNATCICLNGYVRPSANESCILMTSPIPSQNESSTEASTNLLPSTTQITTQEPEGEPKKPERVRSALNLTANEKADVVSIGLDPASSALDWIFKKEETFRTVVASLCSNTSANITVTSDDVVFVAPSPLLTNAEGLLVSFLIRDALGVSLPRDPVPGGSGTESIIARHQRRQSTKRNRAKVLDTPVQKEMKSGYFPSDGIVTALRKGEKILEEALNQTVVALYGGGIPPELLNSLPENLKGPCASASSTLFERRLDVFIPIIMVGGLCIIALIIGSIVIRSRKRRSSQKWDPQPASVTFCKATLRREDTVTPGDLSGSVTNRSTGHSLPAVGGHHLASDDQCRDGEVKLVFNNSQHLNRQRNDDDNDDDAWVVPFDDGQEHGDRPNKTSSRYLGVRPKRNSR